MQELKILVEIDLKEKNVYIAEESSSGAEYEYKDASDLGDKIKFYITNYYNKEVNKNRRKQ